MNLTAVERLVRSSISEGVTDEAIFDMRVALGELYLVQVLGLPRREKESLMRDKSFWDWWIKERVAIMDKSFLQYLAHWNLSLVSSGEYVFFMEQQVQKQPYYNVNLRNKREHTRENYTI